VNFVQQLMRAPVITPPETRQYNPRKTKPQHRGSEGRYRLFLEGQKKSIPEIATYMGYTYAGCRASVLRMVARGDVKRIREMASNGNKGRRPALYTWVVR